MFTIYKYVKVNIKSLQMYAQLVQGGCLGGVWVEAGVGGVVVWWVDRCS